MRYDDIIKTVSEIIDNENIYKKNLVLVYELDDTMHKKMDEHLYYKANPESSEFIHRDVIELEIGGIIVRFIKKDLES